MSQLARWMAALVFGAAMVGCSSGAVREQVERDKHVEEKSLVDASGVATPPAVADDQRVRPEVRVTLINGTERDVAMVRLLVDLSYEGTSYHDAQVVKPLETEGGFRNVLAKDGGKISFPVQFREYKGKGDAKEATHAGVCHVRVTEVGFGG